jgi:hypothetical protein
VLYCGKDISEEHESNPPEIHTEIQRTTNTLMPDFLINFNIPFQGRSIPLLRSSFEDLAIDSGQLSNGEDAV